MTTPQLEAVQVGADVAGATVLDGVNLAVDSGAVLVITGPSGSGKTILVSVLAGVARPDRGEVLLAGTPLRDLGDLGDGGTRPALVPQDFGLVPTLTALESVALPLQVQGLGHDEIRARAATALDEIGLHACLQRLVEELSGGQRQRVAIARALATGAPFVVMDEPTAELDAANRDLVLSLIAAAQARGTGFAVVSHDRAVIEVADAVYELPGWQHPTT